MTSALQWGGRFASKPDAELLAFGSSLEEDLVLAPYDLRCSQAHVTALINGGVIPEGTAAALRGALTQLSGEVQSGEFAAFARASGAEDVHGAIDARVRELCSNGEGEWLHAGRSRNDQVATTLMLYARDRAREGRAAAIGIGRDFIGKAKRELDAQTFMCATTHWQPAQPVLLAFWLCAAADPFVRATRRFERAEEGAVAFSPLGSAAVAGSTLPLDRNASAAELRFSAPSRNAMDAIGSRDAALDVAHAYVRAVVDASRIAGELVIWATPQFGYVRLGDASSTGSSLMPQKRNPDAFELVRASAAEVNGTYGAAISTLCGLPLGYHRDLQIVKKLALATIERGSAALRAFARALADVSFDGERMNAHAADGYAIATDVSDALVLRGVSAREAHQRVGHVVSAAENEGRAISQTDLAALGVSAPLDARSSVTAKKTAGSTNPEEVRKAIFAIEDELRPFDGAYTERGPSRSRSARDDKK
jgi:argininosuccinate lyase